jgi:hypothetical protein
MPGTEFTSASVMWKFTMLSQQLDRAPESGLEGEPEMIALALHAVPTGRRQLSAPESREAHARHRKEAALRKSHLHGV